MIDYEKLHRLLRSSFTQQQQPYRDVDVIFLCDDNKKSRG